MKTLIKGFTYAFKRNIGWQDRVVRTIIGITSAIGAIYFIKINPIAAIAFAVLVIAQVGTVLLARCVICYFSKRCTITTTEKNSLTSKDIEFEK